jgi:hypothetical protein
VAAYTKNGALTIINSAESTFINALFVSGDDIYAAGDHGQSNLPCYWKNGQQINLEGEFFSGGAVGIFVSGADVYVVGGDKFPVYWKNSQRVVLPAGGENFQTQAIVVNGNDVHVAGTGAWTEMGVGLGLYWKNGAQKPLTFSPGAYTSWFTSMSVDEEGRVYITGNQRVIANGVESALATIWIDGVPNILRHDSNTTTGFAICTGMIVDKGFVRAVGRIMGGNQAPIYWDGLANPATKLPHNNETGDTYFISAK